jgi:hypothetical protein
VEAVVSVAERSTAAAEIVVVGASGALGSGGGVSGTTSGRVFGEPVLGGLVAGTVSGGSEIGGLGAS